MSMSAGGDGPAPESGFWIDTPERPVAGESARHPAATTRRRLDRRVVAAAVLLVAVWGALLLVGRLVGGDEGAEERAREELAPEPTATPQPEPTPTPTRPTPPVVDDAPNDAVDVRRIAIAATGQADRLQRQLVRRDVDVSVAYRTASGVAAFDLDEGDIVELLLSPADGDLGLYEGAQLLRSGNDVLSIARDRSFATMLRSDGSLVVAESPDGGVWVVEAAYLGGQAPPVARHDAEGLFSMSSPHAHQLEVVDGLGLVAWSKGPEGGSQVARGERFEPLGEHRLVSASASALVEEVCDELERCKLVVLPLDGRDPWGLPADFVSIGDRFVVSPDARSVLRIDRTGLAEVYSSVDESVSWVIGRGMEHAVWSPDSSFVVWIDLVDRPELKAVFLDERHWVTVDLRAAGAPQPVSTGLTIFSSARQR